MLLNHQEHVQLGQGKACGKMEILKEDLFTCHYMYSVNKEPLKDFAFLRKCTGKSLLLTKFMQSISA